MDGKPVGECLHLSMHICIYICTDGQTTRNIMPPTLSTGWRNKQKTYFAQKIEFHGNDDIIHNSRWNDQ